MAKGSARSIFACKECGGESAKWLGRCPDCGQWNTLVERAASEPSRGRGWTAAETAEPVELAAVRQEASPRMALSIQEMNRVLGGGIVPGSLILVGGDPGIGKSTLLHSETVPSTRRL